MDNKKEQVIVLNNKKVRYTLKRKNLTMKKMFNEFYIIPKDFPFTMEQREFLKVNSLSLLDDMVASGKDGYVVFRGKKPKSLNDKQIEEIKADKKETQRELALKYNVSASTINKIKNNKY
ncbi:hypothetical protein FC778_15340 [Clostridium botulinum]|nr:hypothetical protein [Clostridium botulinum]